MNREFLYTSEFDEVWEKLGLTDNDRLALEVYLSANPTAGKAIKGTGGLRKLRWALKNTGKSGGVRVLYVNFISYEQTHFLDIYAKGKKEDISENEKKQFKKLIKTISENLRKGL